MKRSRANEISMENKITTPDFPENSVDDALAQQREDFLRALQLRLRTPVRANRVTLGHLLEGEYGELSEEQRSVLFMLSENNYEIERLLTMLVTLYRFQNGKAELRKEKCNFANLVEPVVAELAAKAKQRAIEVRRNCRSQNALVQCDFVELQRLFHHLLDNAIKYAKTTVNIMCAIENTRLIFMIEDDGAGISETDIANLFNRFYYVSNSGSYAATTGVGLCLCAEIAKAHGGVISCQSEPGKYTRFRVELPCVPS